MNKYFLIILISISLIVYTNSATCNTLTTDATCNADSGCSWTAAKCTGNTACTSHTSTQADCQNTKYGAVTCTWATDTCTGGTPCTGKTGEEACTAASVEGTACTYTAGSCSEKAKEGDSDSKDDNGGSNDDGSDSSFGLKSTILLFLAFLLF